MANYLITGCSRGLGLELATQLAALPANEVNTVIATARSGTSSALNKLIQDSGGRVQFIKLDVTSHTSAKEAAAQIAGSIGHLDVLVNNAGSINWMSSSIDKMDDLSATFNTNVNGVQIVTASLLPLLQKGKQRKVINVSTSVGSIAMSARYAMMNVPAYKVSKAALNMLTVQWALEHNDKGFAFMAISPGWMQTDLGGPSAERTVAEGGKAVLDLIKAKGQEANGKFFNIRVPGWEQSPVLNQYDGAELPW